MAHPVNLTPAATQTHNTAAPTPTSKPLPVDVFIPAPPEAGVSTSSAFSAPPKNPTTDKAQDIGESRFGKRTSSQRGRKKHGHREKKQATPIKTQHDRLVEEGNYLLDKRKDDEALEKFEEVLKTDLYHPDALFNKARCYWLQIQPQQGIDSLNLYLQKYSDAKSDAKAWALRGALRVQQHAYPEALVDLKRSLELKSTNCFLQFTVLGYCFFSFMSVETTARQHLLNPNPSISENDLHLLKGLYSASQQDYGDAISEISQIPGNLAKRIIPILEFLRQPRSNKKEKPEG